MTTTPRVSPAQEADAATRRSWHVKHLLRRALWDVLMATRLYVPLSRLRRHHATVLYYRAVGCHGLPIAEDNVLSVEVFRQHLDYVKQTKNVVSLDHCLDHLERFGQPPPNSLVLTFDDGFACCHDVVAPILEEYGFPATFFVIPGFTESPRPKWDDFLRALSEPFDKWIIRSPAGAIEAEMERLRRVVDPARVDEVTRQLCQGMLTFAQMRSLVDRGFQIQSHGFEHWFMSSQTRAIQKREVAESKRVLEERLGVPVRTFSVPFGYPGSFNQDTVDLLRKHGYTASFGGHVGYLSARSDRLAMPRIVIHRGIDFDRYRLIVSGCMV
jgi:peptidoglycan/xylan/chitin deacetylase (PgdA/CDA1 family)